MNTFKKFNIGDRVNIVNINDFVEDENHNIMIGASGTIIEITHDEVPENIIYRLIDITPTNLSANPGYLDEFFSGELMLDRSEKLKLI